MSCDSLSWLYSLCWACFSVDVSGILANLQSSLCLVIMQRSPSFRLLLQLFFLRSDNIVQALIIIIAFLIEFSLVKAIFFFCKIANFKILIAIDFLDFISNIVCFFYILFLLKIYRLLFDNFFFGF